MHVPATVVERTRQTYYVVGTADNINLLNFRVGGGE